MSGIKDSGGSEDDVAGGPAEAPGGGGEVGGSLEVGGMGGGAMTESYRGAAGCREFRRVIRNAQVDFEAIHLRGQSMDLPGTVRIR
ncbi:MAG: hypothetical protein O3A19_01465 [Planctomycetota bacterium]|nr:hypothetical protein [Planctomycetota bacterium]MDA1025074.1 hypothetical protein [Planctomycetota bacterium]